MECTGFRESVLKLFNHISKFFVSLENVFSDAEIINCGVSQGSILLLIYIHDLPQALNETGS